MVRDPVNKISLKLIKKALMKLDIITYIFSTGQRGRKRKGGETLSLPLIRWPISNKYVGK